MRRALIVGVDHYNFQMPLTGCVQGAMACAALLARHGNGTPNFTTHLLLSPEDDVSRRLLERYIRDLFSGQGDSALFYFCGLGQFEHGLSAGMLLTRDSESPYDGLRVADVLEWANAAQDIDDKLIVLDCWDANPSHLPLQPGTGTVAEGVCMLGHAQSLDQQTPGGSIFTRLFTQGLLGDAANLLGTIDPVGLHHFIDNGLAAWSERPVFKGNLSAPAPLRQVAPRVSPQTLRRLPTWFDSRDSLFELDPSFEASKPDTFDPTHGAIFSQLQCCDRHGLVEPVEAQHLYQAAHNHTGCRLTALGAHYCELARRGYF